MFAYRRCPACHSIHEPTAVCAARSRQQHLQERRDEKRSEAFEADHGARSVDTSHGVLASTAPLENVRPSMTRPRKAAPPHPTPAAHVGRVTDARACVTDAASVTDARTVNAQRQALHRAKNKDSDQIKQAEAKRKRDARAAQGQRKKRVASARNGIS